MKSENAMINAEAALADDVAQTATVAKYLVQRAKRTRYSFGPTWNKAVVDGKVSDHDKLIAHAVKLKVAQRATAKKLRFETLLAKVQQKLSSTTHA
jgi:hypothetical protein